MSASPEPSVSLIAAVDVTAELLATLATQPAVRDNASDPPDPADDAAGWIDAVADEAKRLVRASLRPTTGSYRVTDGVTCDDGRYRYMIFAPDGSIAPGLWFESHDTAVSAASALNRERIEREAAA